MSRQDQTNETINTSCRPRPHPRGRTLRAQMCVHTCNLCA